MSPEERVREALSFHLPFGYGSECEHCLAHARMLAPRVLYAIQAATHAAWGWASVANPAVVYDKALDAALRALTAPRTGEDAAE